MRLPTYGKPRVISCAELLERHVALPRGCLARNDMIFDDVMEVLEAGPDRAIVAEIDSRPRQVTFAERRHQRAYDGPNL